MRIESGLGGYSYQGRYVRTVAETEELAGETAAVSTQRRPGQTAFSSTLFSSSLATALWSIEGGRRSATAASFTQSTRNSGDAERSQAEQIEALYREFDPADDADA